MIDFFSHAAQFLAKLLGAVTLVLFLYFLSAPPLMLLLTRNNPREWPRIYQPLVPGFWCEWTRPLFVWYFDRLWKADTEIRGE